MNPMLTWEVACWRHAEVRRVTGLRRALHRKFFARF